MLLAFHERERGEEDRMLELVMSTEFSWETPLNVNTQIHTLHACSWSLAQAWQCSGCLGNNNNNNIIYKWCNSRTFFLRVRSERTISLHIRSSNQFGSDGRLLRSEVWRWGHTLVHICITGCAFNDTNSYRDTKITSMLQKMVSLETATLCRKRLYYTCIEISLQSTHTTYKSGRSALL